MKQETLKKIVELADGFDYIEGNHNQHVVIRFRNNTILCLIYGIEEWYMYPLLLRRAVEGLNPQWYECSIKNSHIDITRMTPDDNYKTVWDKMYFYENYQKTDYLTPQEQAIEACLIELLEEV